MEKKFIINRVDLGQRVTGYEVFNPAVNGGEVIGMTAKQWRDSHPDLKGNIRDYANVSQLVCLSNLENLNAVFINEGISQSERLAKLNAIAISQMKVLTEDHRLLQLEAADDTEKPQ